jgi:hypothetical protein
LLADCFLIASRVGLVRSIILPNQSDSPLTFSLQTNKEISCYFLFKKNYNPFQQQQSTKWHIDSRAFVRLRIKSGVERYRQPARMEL